MIIKLFSQGTGNGAGPVNYLLSHDEINHTSYKPEIAQGNAKLTKSIIDSISNKHKYTSGVISFAKGEIIDEQQQLKLINDFQKAFAPFNSQDRVNFLWVRHFDKSRLELHFLSPRLDMKSKKAFNLHPPGKANQLFFQSFTRLQNIKFGFEQVDKIVLSDVQIKNTFTAFQNLHQERKEYISRVFDKSNKKDNNKDYDGRRKTNTTNKQSHTKLREFNTSIVKSSLSSAVSTKRNDEITTATTRNNIGEQEGFKHLSNNFKSNANEIECLFKSRGKLTNRASKSTINTNGLSLEEEIRVLALSLNECEIGQGASIIAKLNMLQGQLSRQQAPKLK